MPVEATTSGPPGTCMHKVEVTLSPRIVLKDDRVF